MDGILKNKKVIIEKFEKWLSKILNRSVNVTNFYGDIHIDMLYKDKTQKEWLHSALYIHKLLQEQVSNKYPDLELAICFCLSTTHNSYIPKTFTLRNFNKNMRTPPEILIYNKNEKKLLLKNKVYLSEISDKYKMKAYYYEEKEDVVWRWIYFM